MSTYDNPNSDKKVDGLRIGGLAKPGKTQSLARRAFVAGYERVAKKKGPEGTVEEDKKEKEKLMVSYFSLFR